MMSAFRSRPVLGGVVFLLLGLFLFGAGAWLIVLGGSWYYAIAGAGLIATGALLIAGQRLALLVYGVVWLYTIIWALWESGLDPWNLMPRVVAPTVLGLYLLMPWVRRRLSPRAVDVSGRQLAALLIGAILAAALTQVRFGGAPAFSQTAAPQSTASAQPSDWSFYGRGPEGDRFSEASEITPENVSQLKVAWTSRSGDSADEAEIAHRREFHSEATPLKIGNTLFTCFPHSVIMAIDATSGQTKWRFDPKLKRDGQPYLVCRGVAYAVVDDPACPRRIYAPIFDARIAALNADDGKPCETFAEHGFINQLEGMGDSPTGMTISTSPPLVINDRLIVGSRIRDNVAVDEPAGVVRAYDPKTGALMWAWDLGRGDDAIKALPPGETYTRGTPNVWGALTADPQLNVVYLPLGNATPDYFIGHRRPFDDKYGSSLTALDITTGQLRWTFQTVHHDQWDFDLPVGPSLVDLPGGENGGTIPALIQTTKQGQIFLLNRQTGQPIANVEERPVPTNNVAPGQPISPTQPFSVGMPSFTPQTLKESDLWGATPIDQLLCRIEFRRLRYEGIFTPQSTQGIVGHPAFDGVSDWGGASIDPERKIMVLNTMVMPFKIRLIPRDSQEGEKVSGGNAVGEAPPPNTGLNYYAQHGTPYVAAVGPWLGILRTPCAGPPWGQLSAVDLKTRKLLWNVTLGTSRDTGPYGLRLPLPLGTGAPNIGGSIVTRSGLIFIAATTDQYLRAFDLQSGAELWRSRLPAGGQATPMTYTGSDGHQYVVITAGGHGALGTRYGDYTIAYRLP